MIHRYFVWLHRWTGLLMAAFLVVVGLTGTILAFRSKIDHLLNPQFYAEVKPGQTPLDPATLAERAEALVPQAKPGYFSVGKDQVSISIRPRKNPATGQPYDLAFDHLILDPYTGGELGRCCADSTWRVKFMPFIYQLHTSVALGKHWRVDTRYCRTGMDARLLCRVLFDATARPGRLLETLEIRVANQVASKCFSDQLRFTSRWRIVVLGVVVRLRVV